MWSRWCIVVGAAATGVLAAFAAAAQPFPELAHAYVVYAGDRELWAADADRRLPPASLTKVMTALVVLEDYRPRQEVVIGRTAARSSGSRLKFAAGERFSVESLLTAMLLASANDACAALALAHAGSTDAFVEKMNARAADLGLANTNFTNPCGFDAPRHYSSARDLARLARAALEHPVFAALVAQPVAQITTTDGKRAFRLRNKNALIGSYEPAIGVKSGFTNRAGKCLIALARKNDVEVLLVMLHANNRWWDAIGVLEHAFDEAGAHAVQ